MSWLNLDDLTTADRLRAAILHHLPGLVEDEAGGDTFLTYDPDGAVPAERRFPFLTLVTGDHGEDVSRLDRDERTYRVNLGIGTGRYEERFGPAPRERDEQGRLDVGSGAGAGHDPTAVDRLFPHPYYANHHFVAVVNPGAGTVDDLADLVDHAYALAKRTYDGRRDRDRERSREG